MLLISLIHGHEANTISLWAHLISPNLYIFFTPSPLLLPLQIFFYFLFSIFGPCWAWASHTSLQEKPLLKCASLLDLDPNYWAWACFKLNEEVFLLQLIEPTRADPITYWA